MADKKHSESDDKTGGVVRRRLIGAAAMLLLAFVLWHLGESAPPAQVTLPSPPVAEWQEPDSEVLRDAESRLGEGRAVLDNIDDDGGSVADADVFAAAENAGADASVNNDEIASDGETSPTTAAAKPPEQPAGEARKKADENSGKSFFAGVYAEAKNVEALVERLHSAGWQTEIRTHKTDDAEDGKILQRVVVVNLPDDDAVAAVSVFLQTPSFVVQIGAFTNPAKAEDAKKKLQNGGYTTLISQTSRSGVLLHRVRAAGYQNRAAAEEARRDLRGLGYVDAQVIDLR